MHAVVTFVEALAPGTEPVSVDQAKAQCRRTSTFHADDVWFDDAVAAARRKVEADTGLRLLSGRYEQRVAGFGCGLRLLKAPLIEVESVEYVDTAGATQLWDDANYVVIPGQTGPPPSHGRLELGYGLTWPTVRGQSDAVLVTFTAGFGAVADVPRDLVLAMLQLIAHWYELRGVAVTGTIIQEVPLAYAALIDPWRVYPMPVAL